MRQPIAILLQTTIPSLQDDWHIERFSLLTRYLSNLTGKDGGPLFAITARDRAPPGRPDPILATLDQAEFQQLWLFAVDTGDGKAIRTRYCGTLRTRAASSAIFPRILTKAP